MLCVGHSSGAVHRKSNPVCRVDCRGSRQTAEEVPVSLMVALQSIFLLLCLTHVKGKRK